MTEFFKAKDSNEPLDILSREIAEIKETLQSRTQKIESALKQARALAAGEAQRVEEVEKSLKAEAAQLEAQLREKEEILHTRESAIQELQNRGKENEQLLGVRDAEVRDLKSNVDVLGERIAQMESAAKEAEALAAREALRVEEVQESLRAEVAGLQSQLREKEEILRGRESSIHELEKSLTAQVQDLQNQAREKRELLEIRDAELRDVKSKMDVLMKRIARMESLFKEAEALAAGSKVEEIGGVGSVYLGQEPEGGEEKSGSLNFQREPVVEQARQMESATNTEAKEEEIRKLQERMSGEIERLRAELKEKKILLAEREREEWRAKGQSKMWKGKLRGWTGL